MRKELDQELRLKIMLLPANSLIEYPGLGIRISRLTNLNMANHELTNQIIVVLWLLFLPSPQTTFYASS